MCHICLVHIFRSVNCEYIINRLKDWGKIIRHILKKTWLPSTHHNFFSYITTRTEHDVLSALYYSNIISWIFTVLEHWNNNPRVDLSPTRTHYLINLCSCSLMLNGEAPYTNFIVWFDPNGLRNPWFTTIVVSMLAITLSIWLIFP